MTALQAGTILAFFSPLAIGAHHIGRIIPIGAAFLRCFGIWSLTTPDPRQSLRPSSPVAAAVLRFLGLIDAAVNLYVLVLASPTFLNSILGFFMLVGAPWCSFLAQSFCIASLSKRIPDRSYSKAARVGVFLLPASLAGLAAVVAIVEMYVSNVVTAVLLLITGIGVICSVAILPLQLDRMKKHIAR